MTSQTKPMMASGLGLATAAALVASAVALPAVHNMADVQMPSLSSAFTLVDSEHHWEGGWGNGNGHHWSDSDDDSSYVTTSYYEDDDDDHHGHRGGFGNIFGMIGNFLTNNQAEVEAFAAGVPTFYLGPVQLGQGVLASAFYNGYNGSATGLPGVIAYVTSQIGDVTAFIRNTVLSVTGMIPAIPLGPVWVGGGRLATAFFDGYNGSATGLAGIISYVTASLGLQTPPAPAAAAKSAASSLPRASAATVTVATPATAAAAASRKVAKAASAKAASAKAAPRAAAAARHAK